MKGVSSIKAHTFYLVYKVHLYRLNYYDFLNQPKYANKTDNKAGIII